jgi:hypothetical protein
MTGFGQATHRCAGCNTASSSLAVGGNVVGRGAMPISSHPYAMNMLRCQGVDGLPQHRLYDISPEMLANPGVVAG